jgi:flagellar biosynthesis component FlhA
MDSGWLASIIVIGINIFGWGVIFGKLNGRVKSLEQTSERHEKTLNDGLMQQMGMLQAQCASLKGTLDTYIDLRKVSDTR